LSAARTALALGLLAAAPLVMGCGLLFDGVYLIASKRYTDTVQERKPTGQVITAVEYAAVPGDGGQTRLSCEERERRIERSFTVEKTFQRRGGFDTGTYVGAATVSGLVATITAVTLAAVCLREPKPGAKRLSCLSMLAAAPFAVDVIYSIIRAKTAKPAKLVDKHTSEVTLDFAPQPTRTKPVPCDTVQQVMLGYVVGPSDTDALNGRGEGQKPHFADGALPVTLGEGGTFSLAEQPDVVRAWAKNASLGLWVVDGEGAPRRLTIDRCTALRPVSAMLVGEELSAFQRSCPLSPPSQPR
jgi:hypothetical protein